MQRALTAARKTLVPRIGFVQGQQVSAPFFSDASAGIRMPQEVKVLSNRMKAMVRKKMILEGYEWPFDQEKVQFPRPVKAKRLKRRLQNPEKKLLRIKDAIPRREAMLRSHASKKRGRHRVQLENLNMYQIVKYRMKDD
jgi:hypothetical protein